MSWINNKYLLARVKKQNKIKKIEKFIALIILIAIWLYIFLAFASYLIN